MEAFTGYDDSLVVAQNEADPSQKRRLVRRDIIPLIEIGKHIYIGFWINLIPIDDYLPIILMHNVDPAGFIVHYQEFYHPVFSACRCPFHCDNLSGSGIHKSLKDIIRGFGRTDPHRNAPNRYYIITTSEQCREFRVDTPTLGDCAALVLA